MPESWENIYTHVNGQACSYSLGEQFVLFNYVDFSFFFFLNWRHIEVFSTWVWSFFLKICHMLASHFLHRLDFFVPSVGSPSWNIQYIQSALSENSLIKRPGLREPARDVWGTVIHLNIGKTCYSLSWRNEKKGQHYWGPRRDGAIENDPPQISSGKINNQHFSSSPLYPAYTYTIHPQLIELNWKPNTTITIIINLAMESTEASFQGYRTGWRKAGRNLGGPWGITSSSALSSLLKQLLIMNSLHLALSSSHWLLISKQGVLACLGWNKIYHQLGSHKHRNLFLTILKVGEVHD